MNKKNKKQKIENLITPHGIIKIQLAERYEKKKEDLMYTLPIYIDESNCFYYYYDQSEFSLGMKPLIQKPKITGDFQKDVLDHYHNSFTEKDLKYIFQFKDMTTLTKTKRHKHKP